MVKKKKIDEDEELSENASERFRVLE